ncbi:Ig-like domain-containing protein [Leifsonia xyli]|uniref:Ig-like domain-containing protein n=1 Tax=Leifsonia xyli TaxID=1575 RepID=UPI003D678D52
MSFASVAALAALVLSAAGLIGDAPPAAAARGTAPLVVSAPTQSATGIRAPATAGTSTAGTSTAGTATAPASAAPSAPAPADTTTPSSTPSPTPTAQPLTLDRLPSGLVTVFPVAVSGHGTPGDTVDVSGGSSPGAAESCSTTVRADGRWSCGLATLPDGSGVPVRAEARSGAAVSSRVQVLHPPVIAGSGVVSTTGGVRGSAYPGARVTVTADSGASCTFPADSSGSWGCVLSGALGDGRHTVTATQVADFSSQRSAASAPATLQVDRTAPGAPSISAPTGGSAQPGAPVSFAGAGETGAHVTLYASTPQGTTVVCTATVSAGAWACQGSLAAGDYTLSALQRDAAGNVSAGSNTVALSVAVAGAPAAAPAPTREPVPTPSPSSPTPAPASPGAAPPTGPTPPDTRGWVDAPFTTASAPAVSAAALPDWMRSVGLAVAALLLLVLPARLLTASLARARADRARGAARTSVFGRNRPRSDVSDASALFGRTPGRAGTERDTVGGGAAGTGGAGAAASGIASGRLSLGATAGAGLAAVLLVTLSAPVPDAGTYPSVLLAVALAVAVVNAVWVLAGRGLAVHLHLAAPRVILRPGLLIVVAVAAIGSRLLGLSPRCCSRWCSASRSVRTRAVCAAAASPPCRSPPSPPSGCWPGWRWACSERRTTRSAHSSWSWSTPWR